MKGTRGGVTGGNEGAPHCRTKDDTMLKRIGLLTAVGVLCVSWAGAAQAQCVVDTSTPTYDNGKFLRYTPCNENGAIKTTGAGGGGGDATAANQTTIIGHVDGIEGLLTTMDADTGAISLGVGGTADAAATAGSTGSLNAKQRLLTSQMDSVKTAVEALDASIPAAAALADATSNPTTTGVAAYNMCFNGTTWDRCAGTSTLHYATSAASTNATNIKASAGTVSVISVVNTTATLYYLRMYNLASAPTCSSATGFVNTIPVPASTSGAGIVIPIAVPHAYTTGIGYCLTGGGSSTDNTNAATGVYINIWYK